jgi:hypothetical protein
MKFADSDKNGSFCAARADAAISATAGLLVA